MIKTKLPEKYQIKTDKIHLRKTHFDPARGARWYNEQNRRMSRMTYKKKSLKQKPTVLGSTWLISTVCSLSCGAVLFIPVSHVCASPARVLQSNLPPPSLPVTPSGNTYFLPPAPPRPPAVRWRGEERNVGVKRCMSCALDGTI